jgi:hypothetical protein
MLSLRLFLEALLCIHAIPSGSEKYRMDPTLTGKINAIIDIKEQ